MNYILEVFKMVSDKSIENKKVSKKGKELLSEIVQLQSDISDIEREIQARREKIKTLKDLS